MFSVNWKAFEKNKTANPPKTALAKTFAMRVIELLMPDAVPDKCSSAALITVAVSGATVKDIPNPNTKMPGKKLVQ